MTKILIGVIGCLILVASTAWSQDAMYYYDLGVRSTVTYEKIHYFTKALELNPRLYSAYEKRGRLYYYREQYSKMIEDFRKVTDMDPEHYDYRYFTVADALASYASDSGYINATSARRVGLVAMIVLLFVVIFKVVLPAPDKRDTR